MNRSFDEFAFAVTKCIDRSEKRALLTAFKTPAVFLGETDKTILGMDIIKKESLSILREEYGSRLMAERYRAYFSDPLNGISFIYDEDFPVALRHIHNPPVALFVRGRLPDKKERLIAMVGARRCSGYGRLFSEKIGKELAENGFSVVSGMAMGIDGYSHRGALMAGGKTYAFLGSGTDICYPACNRDIYEQIPHSGALISEFPPGTGPLKQNFPDRNRLISGISESVLVIEARERSGSLITADLALDQGKDVYALPGRITDPLSAGTNRLIWQGAGMIRSSESLIMALKMEEEPLVSEELEQALSELNLEKDEMVVYSCFDFYAKSIDEVQKETGMTLLMLLRIVAALCCKGYLKEVFMNHYVRNIPV